MKNTKKNYKSNSKKQKIEGVVKIYIISSFNNTIITACRPSGEPVATASGGSAGFKNTRESTPFAAQSAADIICSKLKDFKVSDVVVIMKGMGAGRDSGLKTIANSFNVLEIHDATPIMHNGTRLKKRRRS
ncbi:30S ribosomal protein S11 [Alphaproteobacteria bacterium endosymbiont of Tiliacea citrago]|uniref:30S ribosomal protein S11 n=1 Tax=Alphaproteobacteria bacterium endosymbiont of Tiliacea citrago TaxID=3077944 RepID=UPI00313ABB01